jgi:hypothetical protein
MSTAPEKHVSKRGCLKSRRSRILLAVVVFTVILAAVIPPVVVTTLRKKNSMGPKSKVFVPLYVYPAPGAWTPLENVYVLPFQSSPGPNLPDLPFAFSRKSNPNQPVAPIHDRDNIMLLGRQPCTMAPSEGPQKSQKSTK